MTTELRALSALVKAKLLSLTDDGSVGNPIFEDVFDYAQGDFKGYPVAVILPTGGSQGAQIDTHRIQRVYSFQVTCYQEQSAAGADKATATDRMKIVAEKVIEAFDTDHDLGGEVQRIEIVKMEFSFKVAAGTFQFATFAVDAVVIVPNA